MDTVLRTVLLMMLIVSPVGAGHLSFCGVGTALNLAPHHHGESINPDAACFDDDNEHHEDEAPCPEDCSFNLFDVSIVRAAHTSSAPTLLVLKTAYTNVNGHSFAFDKRFRTAFRVPPDSRRHACLPEMTGRFLI